MKTHRSRTAKFYLLALVLLTPPVALCQQGGPPPPGPQSGPPPGPPPDGRQREERSTHDYGPQPQRYGPPPRTAPDATGTVSTMRGGLQLGPPGRWWDDNDFARSLGLQPPQQRRMDAIFEQNRPKVLQLYQSYQGEQSNLEVLTRAKALDEPALMAEIDRVGRLRIELEQANTHMLIQIRAQMTSDQLLRLDSHR